MLLLPGHNDKGFTIVFNSRKYVVAGQNVLILSGVFFLNIRYIAIESLRKSNVGAKSILPELFFMLGIRCIAGAVIMFIVVRVEVPYRE